MHEMIRYQHAKTIDECVQVFRSPAAADGDFLEGGDQAGDDSDGGSTAINSMISLIAAIWSSWL